MLLHSTKEEVIELEQQGTRAKKQINSVYIVRALAILGVICVHVSSVPVGDIADRSSSVFAYFNFLNVFNKFGTPTFLFLSAFVLFYSYYDRPLNRDLIVRFYRRRVLYILIPYVICSLYYYIVQIYYSFGETWEQFFRHASLTDFVYEVVQGKAFYHLYYVFINVQFYLLFPFLLWLLQRQPRAAKHLVWIGFVVQWAFVLYNYYSLHYEDKGRLAISYLSPYLLGAFCGIYYDAVKEWLTITRKGLLTKKAFLWIPLWIVWICASLGDVYLWYETRVYETSANSLIYEGLWYAHTLTSSIVLLQISDLLYRKLHPKVANIFIHLGVVSYGVYMVHAVVLFYYFRLPAGHTSVGYSMYVAGGYAVTLAVSWGIVGLTQKFVGGSWLLFGSGPKTSPYLASGRAAQPRPSNTSVSW